MALVLWSIIEIDDERLDLNKALFHAFPPLHQPINETVAGDFGCDPREKQLIGSRQKNARLPSPWLVLQNHDQPLWSGPGFFLLAQKDQL
jgi:hypothetical protein